MIALVIVGAVLGILLISLFLPLTVDFVYNDKVRTKIKYSGITVFDNQKDKDFKKRKRKSKHKTSKESAPAKKDGFLKNIYKQKGFVGTVNYFCELLMIVLKKFKYIIKHFYFKRFKLDIIVATNNASETAIQYGRICAVVYPVLSLLQTVINFKPKSININADFDSKTSKFNISFLVKTKPFYLLIAAICIFAQYLKLQRKERETYERKQSKECN